MIIIRWLLDQRDLQKVMKFVDMAETFHLPVCILSTVPVSNWFAVRTIWHHWKVSIHECHVANNYTMVFSNFEKRFWSSQCIPQEWWQVCPLCVAFWTVGSLHWRAELKYAYRADGDAEDPDKKLAEIEDRLNKYDRHLDLLKLLD